MGSFGENLRREREMRGVGLEEISAATKISVRFLGAIESEEFSKLPGGIFTRSFIRSYAKYLGLDEEHVLAEYLLAAGPQEEINLKWINPARPSLQKEASRSPVLTLLVAAGLLAGGYAVFRYSRRAAEMPAAVSNPPVVSAAPSPAASQSQTLTAPESSPPATASKPKRVSGSPTTSGGADLSPAKTGSAPAGKKAAPAVDGLVLQVAATERVWIAVDADGKTALQRILNPNEVETLKAKEFFDVTVGNAQGIVLTLNDETLKPLGRRGEVKTIHLTYDDLKNNAP